MAHLLTLLFAFALTAQAETWTIEKLNGLAPEFDGPSCYTAALLAKGYVDTVSFVGTKELEFFLNRFCVEKTAAAEPGDWLTLNDRVTSEARPHINHVATYLGEGKVFEKEGGLGKFEPYVQQDPRFQVRPIGASPWFKNYARNGQVMKIYKCEPATIVRSKNAKCETRINAFGMADLRRDFERVLLTHPAKFNPSPANLQTIRRLTELLSELHALDPCRAYFLAMGEMVASSFKSMRIKHLAALPDADEWKATREALEKVLAERFQIY